MQFNIRKPTHIFAMLILLAAVFIIFISPILSFFDPSAFIEDMKMSEPIIILSSIITVLIFIGTPISWYLLVNRYNIKQIFANLNLTIKKIDMAFLWGVVAAISMLVIVSGIGALLYTLGVDGSDLSNVQDLAKHLSIATMFFIIVIQSIGEEIFFRGLLLEKINSFAGEKMAIASTAILFGLAHMAYGKIYPVLMPIIMGVILGFIVFKTKNLYSAITAHIVFNMISFIMYIFSTQIGIEALIL